MFGGWKYGDGGYYDNNGNSNNNNNDDTTTNNNGNDNNNNKDNNDNKGTHDVDHSSQSNINKHGRVIIIEVMVWITRWYSRGQW